MRAYVDLEKAECPSPNVAPQLSQLKLHNKYHQQGTKAREIRNDWKYLAKWISWFLHFVKYVGPWNVPLSALCRNMSPDLGLVATGEQEWGNVWVSCHFKVTWF